MSGTVSLSVVEGPSKGKRIDFTERMVAIAGRAEDCQPRIEEGARKLVSRHHCLFDVNPPDVRVRDFGSLNGTYVNDVSIGKRNKGTMPEAVARLSLPEQDLRDGDVVKLGDTVLRVNIVKPLEFAWEPSTRQCAHCGGIVEAGEGRGGEAICEDCRAAPDCLLDALLNRAAAGDQTLTGIADYEHVRELGCSGQGRVYLVRHRMTGQLEALKLLLPKVSVEHTIRVGFLREIANIQALQHQNVAGLRQFGCAGAVFYYTTEFCTAGSVQDLVAARGEPLSVDHAIRIVLQALDGLAYAHNVVLGLDARGLVHRDIKPANILLTGNGENQVAKLGDFGVAKAFDRAGLSGQSMTGEAAGTFGFMGRKQLINYKYAKPDVDIWSMAASLYWMMTERLPRQVTAGADPILAVLNESAVPIRVRNPEIPTRLAEVIDATLVEKPASRINTASAFSEALRSAM
jgi:eukaryotic-like serine/threonine-protein kinase